MLKLDAQVAQTIAESGIDEGVCHVYVPHTTAGVTIAEGADPEFDGPRSRRVLVRVGRG